MLVLLGRSEDFCAMGSLSRKILDAVAKQPRDLVNNSGPVHCVLWVIFALSALGTLAWIS